MSSHFPTDSPDEKLNTVLQLQLEHGIENLAVDDPDSVLLSAVSLTAILMAHRHANLLVILRPKGPQRA
jgi:hypothetical protein